MTASRATKFGFDHQRFAHAYLLGSAPAWTRSQADIAQEMMDGRCFLVNQEASLPAYVSFRAMAREMSGVWLLDTLTPMDAEESYWVTVLRESVAAHLATALTSRIVQRFSATQPARSAAAHTAGWVREGVLQGYYRRRGLPVDAEQWALFRGGPS
jgi:hypothetical protein